MGNVAKSSDAACGARLVASLDFRYRRSERRARDLLGILEREVTTAPNEPADPDEAALRVAVQRLKRSWLAYLTRRRKESLVILRDSIGRTEDQR